MMSFGSVNGVGSCPSTKYGIEEERRKIWNSIALLLCYHDARQYHCFHLKRHTIFAHHWMLNFSNHTKQFYWTFSWLSIVLVFFFVRVFLFCFWLILKNVSIKLLICQWRIHIPTLYVSVVNSLMTYCSGSVKQDNRWLSFRSPAKIVSEYKGSIRKCFSRLACNFTNMSKVCSAVPSKLDWCTPQ